MSDEIDLMPHQYDFCESEEDLVFFGGGAGGGKALKNGSKVLTPTGWTNIESLSVGDSIISPDNTVEKVTGVFPQGELPLNLITFQDGRQSVCCDDHLWSLWEVGRGNVKNQKVINTDSIKKLVDEGKKLMIPLSKAVDMDLTPTPIHPYLLGVILGDGCLRTKGSCTFSSEDPYIAEKIKSLGYEVRLWQSKNRCPTYSVIGVRGLFNSLGLGMTTSHTKFIPKEYLSGSIKKRQLVVQGMMDTDGYVSVEGKLYYYSSSKQLALDFLYLVRSLGAYGSLNEKFVKYKGERVKTYSVYFNHKNAKDLVSLPRKLERVRSKNTASGLRIESVEPFGRGEATCISVTGDKLFITDDFVVTHNTFAALIDNLQGIHDPDYMSAFFRTTTVEISKGLWLEACKLYKPYLKGSDGKFLGKGHISERDKCITFPSGAKTYFGYLEQDKHADSYYGLELAKIYFEECQFRSWYQFTTLLSRNRSKAQVQKGFRATLNPDREHWVYWFVKRYLDEDGYPIKELSGKRAYYLIVNDQLHTAWSKEELLEKFPKKKCLSYTYIPATVHDNKKLLEFDPTYKDKLDSLPEIKRKQLLEGCWIDVSNEGMYFREEWLGQAERIPVNSEKCRAYDLAFSEKTPTTDPDYTVGIGMAKSPDGYYYIFGDHIDEFGDKDSNIKGRMRKRSGERDRIMMKQAEFDGKNVKIVLPEDSGAAGKDSFIQKVKYFTNKGFVVKRDVAAHNARKLTKAEPFFSACENGLVYIVKSSMSRDTYNWLMNELGMFDGISNSTRIRKDDGVDACATAFNYLAKQDVIPEFELPDMKQLNPFNF